MSKGKPDGKIVTLKMRVRGGDAGIASSLAPKLGPLGVSPKRVADDIAAMSKEFTGIKVQVLVTIENRQATVELIPTAAALIIKALKEPVRDRKKTKNITHDGDLTIHDIIEIARQIRPRSKAREFKGTVKEVLGTCQCCGCSVDGDTPRAVQQAISDGRIELPEED